MKTFKSWMFSSLGPSPAEKESTLPFTTNAHLVMGKLQTKTEESRVQFNMEGECKDDDEQKAQGMLNCKDF